MPEPAGTWLVCPRCGAQNRPSVAACFLCGQTLGRPVAASAESTGLPPTSVAPELDDRWTAATPKKPDRAGQPYRIETLLLAIALIAVCLGVMYEAPGLGIPLAIVSAIAMARMKFVASRRRDEKRELTVNEKVGVFLATFAMTVLIFMGVATAMIVAVVGAFFVICTAMNPNSGPQTLETVPWLVGGVALACGAFFAARALGRIGIGAGKKPPIDE